MTREKYRQNYEVRLARREEGWIGGGLVVFAGVGHGVVALAGLDLLAGLAGDVEGAEGAVVDLGVGGGVAGEVLGAELVLDLVEGFLEFFAVVASVDDSDRRSTRLNSS